MWLRPSLSKDWMWLKCELHFHSCFVVLYLIPWTLYPCQPIILLLLDITSMLPVLEGVVMELQDCALPLLRGKHLRWWQKIFSNKMIAYFTLFYCIFCEYALNSELIEDLMYWTKMKLLCFAQKKPHKQANERPAYRFYRWIKLKCLI